MYEALPFKHIVVADFEFEFGGHASSEDAKRSGELPRPISGVFKELRTGQTWRVWRDEFGAEPPFPFGPDTLFVAYYASAEVGCFSNRPVRVKHLQTVQHHLWSRCLSRARASLRKHYGVR